MSCRSFGRSLGCYAKICDWRPYEHFVGIREAAGMDPINEYQTTGSKSIAGLCGRAYKISNCVVTSRDDAIAKPAHAPGMFDAVQVRKAQITIDMFPNIVGIKDNRAYERCKCPR